MSFHKLTQVKVLPRSYIDQQAIGKQPQHYAVQVKAADFKKVKIQCEYLRIPFTLTAELQQGQETDDTLIWSYHLCLRHFLRLFAEKH
ncbi:hypothetical protein [Lysinibacillus sp. D4A3_S15]|uniref:hypothetical protein n=1 Tax=Lysinibacillus sp. D4A3_S15 TaxID=2941227 RepID=UPI0020BF393C|nr:hypothetical protein [Lysinibacillus sp. D4A3_S15]